MIGRRFYTGFLDLSEHAHEIAAEDLFNVGVGEAARQQSLRDARQAGRGLEILWQRRNAVEIAADTDVIDTPRGTVHMVIGGGGTSLPSNQLFFDPPACRVITAVGAPDPATGKRPPIYVKEEAPWSAVRNAAHSYGFAAFDLDPGSRAGDFTTIKVTYYDVVGPGGQLAPFETFTLRRPRRD